MSARLEARCKYDTVNHIPKKEIKIIEAAMFKCTRFANLCNFLIMCTQFPTACSLITNRRIGPRFYTERCVLLDGVC